MAVSLVKLKTVANSQELELVRASRRPSINQLTPAQLKQKAARARKLYDKWLDLSRSQSRARNAQVGFGESKANTRLKVNAFREALENFEAKLAKADGSATPTKETPRKTKQTRSAAHRAARSEIRSELSAFQESLKEPSRTAAKKKAVKKAATKKASPKKAPSKLAAAKKPSAKKSSAPKASPTKVKESTAQPAKKKKAVKKARSANASTGNTGLELNRGKARRATAAAKKRRIDRSGLTSRVRGHVSARGKRAQGRRDSKDKPQHD